MQKRPRLLRYPLHEWIQSLSRQIIPFTAHSFDTSFLLGASLMSSFELRCTSRTRPTQCVVQNDPARRWMQFSSSRLHPSGEKELSVSSLAAPSALGDVDSPHSIRIAARACRRQNGGSDVLVHSRTTHVHVCVIPGIDRSLLDRSGAGSMLFLPFARDFSFYLLLASLATRY